MIQDLRLQQFRSYDDSSFEFEPGVNIIVGPNASGKTNLLEALLVVGTGKSYRAKDKDLLQQGKDWARIDALNDGLTRVLKLQANESIRTLKTFELEDVTKKRLTLADTVPIVLFEPTDLQLLTGSPERRRSFLDTMLQRTLPHYSRTLRNYERILLQRNTLLKQQKSISKDELFVWNLRLSEFGGQIADARMTLVSELNKEINNYYKSVAGHKKSISVSYSSKVAINNYGSHMLQMLEKGLSHDLVRGFTGFGPHRDDLSVLFSDKNVADVASRGETRTLVLGFKMLELSLVEKARDKKPILLLDDVFSELDGARRKALTEFLQGHQTFITTTDADVVVDHFMKSCNVIAL